MFILSLWNVKSQLIASQSVGSLTSHTQLTKQTSNYWNLIWTANGNNSHVYDLRSFAMQLKKIVVEHCTGIAEVRVRIPVQAFPPTA